MANTNKCLRNNLLNAVAHKNKMSDINTEVPYKDTERATYILRVVKSSLLPKKIYF